MTAYEFLTTEITKAHFGLRVAITGIITLLVLFLVRRLLDDPLNNFPGPLAARFTNLWRFIDALHCKTDQTQRALHARYGPAVRIGPSCISLSDPSLIPLLYATRQPYVKSDFYSAGDTVTQGRRLQAQFVTRDEAWHDYLVRPVKSSYSLSSILKFEPLVDSTLDHFMSILKKEYMAKEGQRLPCPIGDLLMSAAWDVAGEMTFSKRLGMLEGNREMLSLRNANEKSLAYLTVVGQMPWLDRILRNSFLSLGPPGFKVAADYSTVELKARIEAREADLQPSANRDFIDVFIDAEKDKEQGGEGQQLTRRQISWLIMNVVAGSDTTAATLKAVVYYTLRNPRIKSRLVQELGSASEGEVLTWRTCHSLPYLDAVIKEALRLCPAVGMLLERVVPAGGLTLKDGRTIPAGTCVGINPRVVNHDQASYGSDAAEFNPERWLQQPDESETDFAARTNRMKAADLTFGAGRRSCIGRNMALLVIYKFIARLFAEFDLELSEPNKKWLIKNGWFIKQDGVNVFLNDKFS